MSNSELRQSLASLLRDQQTIVLESAVHVFAQRQEMGTGRYQSLIPFEQPKAGQQYRFEVDLDECTGCKSCVSACHSLNGLDAGETWRKVGSLEQSRPGRLSLSQTITSSCHHCLEPACALGCPVKAYEKDPITGIVKHLDDQCIGCQYCQMMCPYDVPVYNQRLGIVRKCDMCQSRLKQGEAPACVQACPTDAIKIGIVDQSALTEQVFLPASADPSLTKPSTLYKRGQALPKDLEAGDHMKLHAEAAHQPLVGMLLLSQMGVGMLFWEAISSLFFMPMPPNHSLMAVALVASAMTLATLHLGRPWKAWRFILGLRTSWMSREILAFSIFMFIGTLAAIDADLTHARWTLAKTLLLGCGLIGVYCSAMIYIQTKRPTWNSFRCLIRFSGSTLLLGILGSFAVSIWQDKPHSPDINQVIISLILTLLLGKCLFEAREHLDDFQKFSVSFRSLLIQWRLLSYWTWARWLSAWVTASSLLLALTDTSNGLIVLLAAITCLIGEYCERSLFFQSAFSPSMPGI